MNNLVKIGNSDLSIKEFNGQRVVTFKDVDSVHERPDGTARKRFNDNRSRFIEGEDFYKICPSEIRTHKIMEISEMAREDVTLLTESGYLMLVKSFTDDLAWEVQRELVKTYFNKKKPMSPVEMMRIQLGMIDDHEGRITDLEQKYTYETINEIKECLVNNFYNGSPFSKSLKPVSEWMIDTPDGRILFITDAEYCPYDFSKMHINYGLIECNYSEDYIRIEDSSPKYNHVLTGHMELETCKRLIQKIIALFSALLVLS